MSVSIINDSLATSIFDIIILAIHVHNNSDLTNSLFMGQTVHFSNTNGKCNMECIFREGSLFFEFKGKLARKLLTCYLECISYHLPIDKK